MPSDREARGEHRAAATGKCQPESAEELGSKTSRHVHWKLPTCAPAEGPPDRLNFTNGLYCVGGRLQLQAVSIASTLGGLLRIRHVTVSAMGRTCPAAPSQRLSFSRVERRRPMGIETAPHPGTRFLSDRARQTSNPSLSRFEPASRRRASPCRSPNRRAPTVRTRCEHAGMQTDLASHKTRSAK